VDRHLRRVRSGMRLVAPRRSRNCSRVSQRRRRTTSSSISAMWAAGPPKPTTPSFRKRRATSPVLPRGAAASVAGSLAAAPSGIGRLSARSIYSRVEARA
jgi:hypothetical protein